MSVVTRFYGGRAVRVALPDEMVPLEEVELMGDRRSPQARAALRSDLRGLRRVLDAKLPRMMRRSSAKLLTPGSSRYEVKAFDGRTFGSEPEAAAAARALAASGRRVSVKMVGAQHAWEPSARWQVSAR